MIKMQELIKSVKDAQDKAQQLSFSSYSSIKEQRILNVPILKPLLIFTLSGAKCLGKDNEITCQAGNFIFLANHSSIDMRNIPNDEEYLSITIEFEYSDFNQFKYKKKNTKNYLQGKIDSLLVKTLQQYIEWTAFTPPKVWHFRREELLQLIYLSGHEDVATLAKPPTFSHLLHHMIHDDISSNWGVDRLVEKLSISESTLLRKLKAEGTDIQTIRDQAKLSHALHLVQTTTKPIGLIAEYCGYRSQSRFTGKFKHFFGVTPSELRKQKHNRSKAKLNE